MTRLVSVLVALVASLGGHALLFWSSFYLLVSVSAFQTHVPAFVAPAAIAGILLIGVSVLTAGWASLGVYVLGALQTVIGLAMVVIPAQVGGGMSPRGAIDRVLLGLGSFGQGADVWMSLGATLVEGVLLLVIGFVAARRRRSLVAHPGLARILAVIVTFVALAPGALLAIHGGYLTFRRTVELLAGPDALGIVLLVLGIAILAALLVGTRWSGLGAIVWGALLTVSGLAATILPALLPTQVAVGVRGTVTAPLLRNLPRDLSASVLTNLELGTIAVVGVVFLCGGIAAARAGRTGRRRATFVGAGTATAGADGPPAPWAEAPRTEARA